MSYLGALLVVITRIRIQEHVDSAAHRSCAASEPALTEHLARLVVAVTHNWSVART
jgi:hypothetical protein